MQKYDPKNFEIVRPFIGCDFVDWLTTNGFFEAPASAGHHGAYAGGLFDHSFIVTDKLVDLTKNNELYWENERSPVIIGMFHDLCKIEQYRATGNPERPYEYREDAPKGHGDRSVEILSKFFDLTEEEALCIRYHMGAFTDKSEWKDYTAAIHKYSNVLWTHQADMIAAHVLNC